MRGRKTLESFVHIKNSCLLYMNTPPKRPHRDIGTPPQGTQGREHPAPNKEHAKSVEKMNEVIEGIKKVTHTNSVLETFKEKLHSGKTHALERLNQNPANRIFIDNEDVEPRYVYKIAYGSVVDKELDAYKKLKIHDTENTHFLKLVSEAIRINENYSMFITEYKKGLTPENLLYTKLEDAKEQDNEKEVKRLKGLIESAMKYLTDASITHGDIAGNLYEVDGTFFWIDFEIQTSSSSATGLFGPDSESEESPVNELGVSEESPVNELGISEESPVNELGVSEESPVARRLFGGKKNKKSKKKRKARSSRKKSRKSSKKR